MRLMLKTLESFIREFFDQNPLSQLGIISTHNSIAEKITELNSNFWTFVLRMRYNFLR
jgi:transcription initiation factor TFIIH subunit 2